MRIRVRGPGGQSTVTLNDSATLADLYKEINAATSLPEYDIKYGYPPKPLSLDELQPQTPIANIGVNLNGEQLIISAKRGAPPANAPDHEGLQSQGQTVQPNHSHDNNNNKPGSLSLTRKDTGVENDPPEVPCAEHSATAVLRIMPDDNSCLFRAVGNAVIGGMDTMTELRSIIAQTIQSQPDLYTSTVLERSPDDYCRWIQSDEAWGGGIELSILSNYFDIEICSIDVQSLRVDRFNEGRPTRCIVVYSGIHYDTIALSPSETPFTKSYAPPEFDTKIFDSADPVVLEKAVLLCQILQQKHYFTDTGAFSVKCNICNNIFIGEKGATQHASETGHYDFGEAG